MSDKGEKTCPLCAEEMDLTDQQLKPCRCGYEICVWCWHHIMEMAEKDGTEGRCPACRTPYDKEKIVGTAANCERLVAEVNMEKRHKSQKAKPKTSESRKQLTSVRVIQRNLVYIVGLPPDLADEDLLQSNEYFGQYGKVLKVSISRTSAGTIQQFPNNTCSVYITYARDDEAVRCIQSVHAFILDGRPLRVCFGTTKYCHAWLRNAPCNNPDCLYLHDIGSEEDSFTKDDIVSAYSRVQQITGKTTNMQQRSGNFLPSPTDGYCNYSSSVSRNPSVKSSLNNSVRSVKGSPPSSSSIRSGGLPAAASWGTRASNCNPPTESLASTNGFNKKKADATHGLPVIEPIVSNSLEASILPNDVGKRHVLNEETQAMEPEREMEASVKRHLDSNSHGSISEASSTGLGAVDVKSTNQTSCSLPADYIEREGGSLLNTRYAIDERPLSPCKHEGGSSTADVDIRKSAVGISSTGIDQQSNGECSKALRPDGSTLDTPVSHNDHCLQWHEPERTPALQNLTCETEDDFNNQRLRDAIVSKAPTPASTLLHNLNNLRAPSQQVDTDFTGNYTVNRPIVYNDSNEGLGINVPSASISSNGFMKHLIDHASDQVNSVVNDFQGNHMGPCGTEVAHMERPTLDIREKHLISNILSLDLDSWGDSLTSQNLAQFFGDNDRHEASLKSANAWKSQISNQSRFSFARQEDSRNHIFDFEPTVGNNSHSANSSSFGQGFEDTRLDRHGNGFVYHHSNQELSDSYLGGNTAFPASKLPVSRSLIAAPSGFTASNRPPPPGFTSHERSDQSLDFLKSGTHLHEIPSFLRNPYQASGNISTTNDIEFMDPAILAVGKGRFPMKVNSSGNDMRQNFHIQAGGFENELSNQLMQKSLSPHQGLGYNGVRDNLSPSNNVYGFTSRHMEQSQTNSAASSHFSFQHPRDTVVSNGQWDGWSESQSPNDMGMALRNDRLGLDKFYGGYEDSKFLMANSGDIYNRSFGI